MKRVLALTLTAQIFFLGTFNSFFDKSIMDAFKDEYKANRTVRTLYRNNVTLNNKIALKAEQKIKIDKIDKIDNETINQDDASAAADTIDISYEDAQLLMKIAMAEAEGEGIKGKAMIMAVVLNRVKSKKFPDTIKKVIFQKKQFSSIKDGRYRKANPDFECHLALADIESGKYLKNKALYFENRKNSWQSKHCRFLFKYKRHRFYR